MLGMSAYNGIKALNSRPTSDNESRINIRKELFGEGIIIGYENLRGCDEDNDGVLDSVKAGYSGGRMSWSQGCSPEDNLWKRLQVKYDEVRG